MDLSDDGDGDSKGDGEGQKEKDDRKLRESDKQEAELGQSSSGLEIAGTCCPGLSFFADSLLFSVVCREKGLAITRRSCVRVVLSVLTVYFFLYIRKRGSTVCWVSTTCMSATTMRMRRLKTTMRRRRPQAVERAPAR